MRWVSQSHQVIELSFLSTGRYKDPYNEVDLDVIFSSPAGTSFKVPAFWAGENVWRVRFAGPTLGDYRFETHCSVQEDAGLHRQTGTITVTPYEGSAPLLLHGRLRVASDRRHFEHQDGTPFFWVGDTWWMGLSTRLDWPQGFKELAADRVEKGFNVVQIIAGPYPDMEAWDPRGRNEAGFPFTPEFASINPLYYDHADLKIGHLIQVGIVPCIVGMWGYYLPEIGIEKIKRFWRHLVARYAAYPVIWCICGEGVMPYYLSETKDQDAAAQKKGWTEVMASVRQEDGYHNPIGIHPTQFGRDQVEDPGLMDFEMLQTGHGDLESVGPTIDSVRTSMAREPRMPVVNSEVNYEGILGRCWQNVQRLCVYHSILNGTAGHTYGANGIWQMSTSQSPYGASPHGRCWGNTPWAEAARLPGSAQTGFAGRFIRRFPWWEMTPHPEWLGASALDKTPYSINSVGIPGRLRLFYIPLCWDAPRIHGVEMDVRYHAGYFDPCTGKDLDLGTVVPDEKGEWTPPFPPECHDWILVMEREA